LGACTQWLAETLALQGQKVEGVGLRRLGRVELLRCRDVSRDWRVPGFDAEAREAACRPREGDAMDRVTVKGA